MKVFVYFNLHKKMFSIKALEGERKGLVIGHCDELTLFNATFKVSQAGRQRVLRERKKNVHAGVVGFWKGCLDSFNVNCKTPVTYNPYKYDSFVYASDGSPIQSASVAYLTHRKIFVN